MKAARTLSHAKSPAAILGLLFLAGLLCFLMTGCAKDYSPDVYGPGGMQQANKVDRAVVHSVREVDVNDPSLGLGTIGGAAAGGLAGSQIGAGTGNAFATLGGVLIGAGVGYLVDQDIQSTTAYEYILEKPNGELMTLAQKQEQPFAIGTHVLILYGVKARIILDDNKNIKSEIETPSRNPLFAGY